MPSGFYRYNGNTWRYAGGAQALGRGRGRIAAAAAQLAEDLEDIIELLRSRYDANAHADAHLRARWLAELDDYDRALHIASDLELRLQRLWSQQSPTPPPQPER